MPEASIDTSLARIQVDPTGPTAPITAFFKEETTVGDRTFNAPWTSVSWSVGSDKPITVEGIGTFTYAEVSTLVTAIAYQERADAAAAALAAAAAAVVPAEPAPAV